MLRPRLETTLSALFAVMTLLTLVRPTWIEAVTGLDPDGGSGGTEWGFVVLLAVLAVCSGLLARRDYIAAGRLRSVRDGNA